MDIKKFTLDDLDEIYKVQEESYPEEVMDSLDKTKTFFNWEIVHGIKINNIVKGIIFGYVESNFLHIYSIEVSKDYRKLGLASKLLEFGIDYAKDNDLELVRAYGFSQAGKNLLKKFNFTKVSEKNLLHYIMDVMILDITNKTI